MYIYDYTHICDPVLHELSRPSDLQSTFVISWQLENSWELNSPIQPTIISLGEIGRQLGCPGLHVAEYSITTKNESKNFRTHTNNCKSEKTTENNKIIQIKISFNKRLSAAPAAPASQKSQRML